MDMNGALSSATLWLSDLSWFVTINATIWKDEVVAEIIWRKRCDTESDAGPADTKIQNPFQR